MKNEPDKSSEPTQSETLQKQFTLAMFDVYRRAKKEADYPATRFHQMVSEMGGYDTAMQLIHDPHPSEGYTALWERGRLDLTVEAVILDSKWNALFSGEDRAAARKRLESYHYDFSAKRK
jgi:hypothetical protein